MQLPRPSPTRALHPGGAATAAFAQPGSESLVELLRGVVAGWFGLQPGELAALDDDTVHRMAARLEGRRTSVPARHAVSPPRTPRLSLHLTGHRPWPAPLG